MRVALPFWNQNPFLGLREKLNQEGNLLRSIIICVQNYQTHFLSKKKMSLRYSLVEQYRHSVYKKKNISWNQSMQITLIFANEIWKMGRVRVGGLISEIAWSLFDWYEAVIYCQYTVCWLVISLWLTVKVIYIILLLSSFKFNKFS